MIRGLLLLLFFAMSAEAAITVTARGTSNSNAASTFSYDVSPTSSLNTVGNTGVIVLGLDNGAGTSVANCTTQVLTDTAGNTWVRWRDIAPALAANAGAETVMYTAYLQFPFTTSTILTVPFNSQIVAKTAAVWEIAPNTSTNQIVPVQIVGTMTGAINATTSPTLTTPESVIVGRVVIGASAAEGTDTWVADAGTTNGTWSTFQHTGVGSSTSAISLVTQYKLTTTAAGTQTYNPTLTSADTTILLAEFAEVDPRVRVMGASNTSETQTVIGIKRPLAAGSIGVLCLAADNALVSGAAGNLPNPASDDKGNSWTLQQNGTADPGSQSQGTETGIYTSVIGTAVAVNDNLTITYTTQPVVAKAWVIYEIAPLAGGTMSVASSGVGTAVAAGTSPTVTTSISIPNGDIVIGMGGAEGADTWVDDTDTSNGSWGIGNHQGHSANTTTGMSVMSQYKRTTGAGTQTYNPTTTANDDSIVSWVSLHETVTTNTANFLQFFP